MHSIRIALFPSGFHTNSYRPPNFCLILAWIDWQAAKKRLEGLGSWEDLKLQTVLVDPPRAGLDEEVGLHALHGCQLLDVLRIVLTKARLTSMRHAKLHNPGFQRHAIPCTMLRGLCPCTHAILALALRHPSSHLHCRLPMQPRSPAGWWPPLTTSSTSAATPRRCTTT